MSPGRDHIEDSSGEQDGSPSPWWFLKLSASVVLIVYTIARQLEWVPGQLSLTVSTAAQSAVQGMAQGMAQGVALTGGAITLYHYVLIKRRNRDLAHPQQLITRGGLFPWIRHPMYLGDMLLYGGLAGLAGDGAAALLLVAVIVGIVGQRGVEEATLASRFGAAHREWTSRTLC